MHLTFFFLLSIAISTNCFNAANAKDEVIIRPLPADNAQAKARIANVLNQPNIRTQSTTDNGLLKFDPLKLGKLDTKLTSKIRPKTSSDKSWEAATIKFKAGAKLEKLDTSPSGKWKATFDNLKTSNQLKNVDEKYAAKITQTVAHVVAKNPSKWRFVKEFVEITLGVVFAALILIGFQSMLS